MKVIEIRKAMLAGVVVLGLCGLAVGGSALEFDGVDDYVDMGDPADGSLDFGSSIDFTVVAWINTVNSAREDIVGRDGTKARHWELMVENNRLRAFIDDGSNFVLATDDGAAINDGEWHQVAVVFDRDGMMERYVDGGAYGTADDISSVGNVNTDGSLYIGCRKTDGDLFDGTIDEVGIYDRALSASEIEEIYHCGVFDDVNLVGYWGFEEGAGQVAYDGSAYGNDGYLGSDPNGADSADPVWAESEVPGVTYHIDVVNGDNGNDGLTKETAFAAIQMGIDSAEDCDTVLVWPGVYNESLFFINKGITVQSAADAAEIVASGIYGALLYTSEGPDSVLKNFVIRDSDTGVYVSSGAPWLEHLTVVNCDLGVEAEAGAEPNIVNSILWNNAYDLFQCTAEYSWVEEEMEPNLVAYWRFEEGSGTTAYDWVSDNDGTLTNGPVWTGGQVGGALEFDGDNDYVELGTIGGTDDLALADSSFTICAWIKPDLTGDGWQRIVDKSDGTTGANGYTFFVHTEKTMGVFIDWNNFRSDGGVITSGIWQHVAVTGDRTDYQLYVDGLPVPGSFFDGSYNSPPSVTTNMRIGTWNHSTDREFNGSMDDVRIYNRALSSAEVEQLYQSGL
ncbi:MAG: hypothetical protein JSW23_00105 [Planctomycetota bacterium]|nr:MAG: hypothetical protein JSW23_00105 [Planctomycetota bacterium]